jgi:hypothetical protein
MSKRPVAVARTQRRMRQNACPGVVIRLRPAFRARARSSSASGEAAGAGTGCTWPASSLGPQRLASLTGLKCAVSYASARLRNRF